MSSALPFNVAGLMLWSVALMVPASLASFMSSASDLRNLSIGPVTSSKARPAGAVFIRARRCSI